MSCLPEPTFSMITTLAYDAWKAAPQGVTVQSVINNLAAIKPAFVLGQHYFIVNPLTGSGTSPKWDFTSASEAGNPNAFVVGAKTGDVPAPTNPQTNVDWLSLKGVQGELATAIYRMDTQGGQPPASVSHPTSFFISRILMDLRPQCTPGSADISVRYSSLYSE